MCSRPGGGRGHKAMILIGDLGDVNAIGRRDGFDAAVKEHAGRSRWCARADRVEIRRRPCRRDQRAARASGHQLHLHLLRLPPAVDRLALRGAGKYRKAGEAGHVLLGGFDGDATAYQMLVDGYLDADGVQNVYYECVQAVQAVFDLRAGKPVPPIIRDPGLVIHRGNLDEAKAQMWGANVRPR